MVVAMKKMLLLLISFSQINMKAGEDALALQDVTNTERYAPIVSVYDLLKDMSNLCYIKCHDSIQLAFNMFPLASSPGSSCAFPCVPETFILKIPQGRVYSSNGTVLINDHLVKELIWQWSPLQRDQKFNLTALPEVVHITGRVAVITQEGYSNYYHWMTEVLPKLAMLEEKKIQYDWLCVPIWEPFMSQTLVLLGIDLQKIIEPLKMTYIEADELIVPSAPSLSCYTPAWIADYLKSKFIPLATQKAPESHFNNKVFISRRRASCRRIINEDDLFKMFEEQGFTRYDLEELSFLEQILLFQNADIIVAAHGAGLVNLLFSKPGTQVIEIFQKREDDTYWYLSQVIGLHHTCVKTTDFNKDGDDADTIVPLTLIEPVINTLK
jgi:hypothetical protein